MPTPSSISDIELPAETETPLPTPEAPEARVGRRPAWWRRALAATLRGAAGAVRPQDQQR